MDSITVVVSDRVKRPLAQPGEILQQTRPLSGADTSSGLHFSHKTARVGGATAAAGAEAIRNRPAASIYKYFFVNTISCS